MQEEHFKWRKKLTDDIDFEAVVHNPKYADIYLHGNVSGIQPIFGRKWIKIGTVSMKSDGNTTALYYNRQELAKVGLDQPVDDAVKEFIKIWITYSITNI